jgi:hypothetical protein
MLRLAFSLYFNQSSPWGFIFLINFESKPTGCY